MLIYRSTSTPREASGPTVPVNHFAFTSANVLVLSVGPVRRSHPEHREGYESDADYEQLLHMSILANGYVLIMTEGTGECEELCLIYGSLTNRSAGV